jgi:hypothetical protein
MAVRASRTVSKGAIILAGLATNNPNATAGPVW